MNDARERECTICPPAVIRCMHFDGQNLALCARDAMPAEAAAKHRAICDSRPIATYGVIDYTGSKIGPCGLHHATGFSKICKEFSTLDAANAAFEQAETVLLGREVLT